MNRDELDLMIKDIEVRLERVRSLYEQYFIGIEKLEPTVARKDLDRRFWALRKVRLRNTALRFRFQTLTQRYNTLQQYWMRICRQIENGTYVRHVRRAARLASGGEQPASAPPGMPASAEEEEENEPPQVYDLGQMLATDLAGDEALSDAIDAAFASVGNPATAASVPSKSEETPAHQPDVKRPARKPPPLPPSRTGLSDQRVRDLHGELARARQSLKQGGVSVESVADRLRSTEAQLRKKHPDKKIDFRVEVRDGKAVIKPFLR